MRSMLVSFGPHFFRLCAVGYSLLMCLILFSTAFPTTALAIGLSPAKLFVDVAPGSSAVGVFTVSRSDVRSSSAVSVLIQSIELKDGDQFIPTDALHVVLDEENLIFERGDSYADIGVQITADDSLEEGDMYRLTIRIQEVGDASIMQGAAGVIEGVVRTDIDSLAGGGEASFIVGSEQLTFDDSFSDEEHVESEAGVSVRWLLMLLFGVIACVGVVWWLKVRRLDS